MQKGPPLSGWSLTCCFLEAARRIELLYRASQEKPEDEPHQR
jgi:hypothetical protein